DDDGDGRVGPGDHAEIVAIDRYGSSGAGNHVVVYGSRFAVAWEHAIGWDSDIDPVFADLDGDGAGEIVLGGVGGGAPFLVAVDAGTGAERWRSEELDLDCAASICQTTAADLDGDGVAEVIVDRWVLDGATGAVEVTLALPDAGEMDTRSPLVADLGLDGIPTLVVGDTAFAPDGTVRWSFDGAGRSAHPALAQLDDDDAAEIALALDRELVFVDTDGTVLFRDALPGAEADGRAGMPCVGDIDGDGASEVVVPGGEALDAYDANGVLAWSVPMYGDDGTGAASGGTGCAVFDFDADGAAEIVLGDALNLRIHDGTSGRVVWETDAYAAYMLLQLPVIADVDADGSAEIVVTSTGHATAIGEAWMGVQVYGHPRDAWRTEGSVWGVADFAVGNQAEGGAMSSAATWLSPGVFRGQVATTDPGELRPGLTVAVMDTCEACDVDEAHVSVAISNVGAADAVDVTVALEAVTSDGAVRVLASTGIPTIAAATSAAAVDLAWAPSDVARGERLLITTDIAGETCAIDGGSLRIEQACR
ncbi:MAG: hypothetical protein ACK4YP_17650, partial [Myxococcota bacterium]